jgi:hypothetical protein
LGILCPLLFLGAVWATALSFDGFAWAVFTQTEFLAALTRLGGADKSEVYLLLVG